MLESARCRLLSLASSRRTCSTLTPTSRRLLVSATMVWQGVLVRARAPSPLRPLPQQQSRRILWTSSWTCSRPRAWPQLRLRLLRVASVASAPLHQARFPRLPHRQQRHSQYRRTMLGRKTTFLACSRCHGYGLICRDLSAESAGSVVQSEGQIGQSSSSFGHVGHFEPHMPVYRCFRVSLHESHFRHGASEIRE